MPPIVATRRASTGEWTTPDTKVNIGQGCCLLKK
jgi:hypothetical protein